MGVFVFAIFLLRLSLCHEIWTQTDYVMSASEQYIQDSFPSDYTVCHIVYNDKAAAVLNGDGSVLVWGQPDRGGYLTPEKMQKLSSGVIKIVSLDRNFAALKADGTITFWGYDDAEYVKGCEILTNLTDVTNIFAIEGMVAALRQDMSILSYGWYLE